MPDSIKEMGQAIEWGWIQVGRDRSIGYTSTVDQDDVIRCLKDDACRELPQGSRFEIRQRSSTNYGRSKGIAWYYCSSFDQLEKWDTDATGFQAEGGYFLIARCVVPVAALPIANATPVIE